MLGRLKTRLMAGAMGVLRQPATDEIFADAAMRAEAERLFDADYYLRSYNDVRNAGVDPFDHYVRFGWREGRNPNRKFDSRYYISKHLGDGKDTCPLIHYLDQGRSRGLATSEEDEKSRLLKVYDRIWGDNFRELLADLGMDTSSFDADLFQRIVIPMFSAEYYRARKGLDAGLSDVELLTRYLAFDLAVGLPPGPAFDADFYCAQAAIKGLPPVTDGKPAFLHWLQHGVPARIVPTPFFLEAAYLRLNKDIALLPDWPFLHWLRHGIPEGRRFTDLFELANPATASLAKRPVPRAIKFLNWAEGSPDVKSAVGEMAMFRSSDLMRDLVSAAARIEPEIGALRQSTLSLVPPLHDRDFSDFAEIRRLVPVDEIRSIILMPFCKLGGADFVASVLAHSLVNDGPVLILRTEQSDWARPDWFPEDAITVDLSRHLAKLAPDLRIRILYELIRTLNAKNVFNVNSRLAFDMFERFGERLALRTRLHAYYFCSDRTPAGLETGYPVWYFANILPHLMTAMIDNACLAETLRERYCLSPELAARTQVVYTPAIGDVLAQPVAQRQIETRTSRKRPLLLWAGRFDRQKRFDLVMRIARQMPDVDFHCWGKAVLDAPPDLSAAPANLTLHEPFTSYDQLPLRDSDGWLYTSSWDGLPTILIEIGAFGVPVVASAAGGVPELIDEETGWPVYADDDAAYVAAIRDMLASESERVKRAAMLQDRVRTRHSRDVYSQKISELSASRGPDV